MKKTLIFSGVIIFLVVSIAFGIRFFSGEDDWICQNGEWVKHGNSTAQKPVGNCGEIKESLGNPITEQEQTINEPSIVVFMPRENAKLSSPFDVEGKAVAFENMIGVRLKDDAGKILFQDSIYVNSPDTGQYGLFQKEIKFETAKAEGVIEVFESSAKDGADINKVIIPVKFSNEERE